MCGFKYFLGGEGELYARSNIAFSAKISNSKTFTNLNCCFCC